MGETRPSSVGDYDEPVVVATLVKKTLEQLRVDAGPQYFPQRVVADVGWVEVENGIKALRAKLSGYVLAEKIADDQYSRTRAFPFPSSPWQFFKERHEHAWWMRWLVRRRPVVYEKHLMKVTVDVPRYLAYPQATILAPEFGSPVQFEQPAVTVEGPHG